MSADFTPEKEDYKILTPFKMQVLTNFPYIEADFDALTNYQLLCKVVEYLNNVITNENEVTEQVTSLYNAYVSLQNYVNTEIGDFESTVNNRVDGLESYMNNYFNNLDVQQEINNKLDAMALDGTLTSLISNYVDPIYRAYENRINTQVNNISDEVQSVASGSPKGVYATVAALTAADPDHNYIYVVSADGHWYYYNTSSSTWSDGGVYQSSVNNEDVDYLIDVDSARNEVDYDMLTDLVTLSKYTNICKNNLIHLISNTVNGISSKIIGLNKAQIAGTATPSSSWLHFSKPISLKASTTYTLGFFEPNVGTGTSLTLQLFVAGENTSYKIDGNNVEISKNPGAQPDEVITFTPPADVDVDLGVWTGNNATKNATLRVFLLEGNYSVSDISTSTRLNDLLNGRVFVGTAVENTVIPTYKTPVFYLVHGTGPFSNFGDTNVSYDNWKIALNNISNNTWSLYNLFQNPNRIQRNSIVHITTDFNPSLSSTQYIWGIADTAGTYTNLLNNQGNPITLSSGEVAILSTVYTTSNGELIHYWNKDTLTNTVNKTYVDSAINTIGEDIESYVYTWLAAHPEATTTVQDGSITVSKLDTSLSNKMNRLHLDNGTLNQDGSGLNTIIGYNNMSNGIGQRNTIVGIENLYNANDSHSPNREIAIGYHSLFRDWNGQYNVSVGNESMDNLSHGEYNVAVGSNALRVQRYSSYQSDASEGETINRNTAIGGNSQYYTYGDNNTSLGYQALRGADYGSTGSGNIAIGSFAGKYNTNENNHLYIDNKDRTSRANEISKSLIYGTFADDITNQEIKINGKFACNGKTPQAPVTAYNDAEDLQTAIDLLNQIKQALIDTGIMK